MKKKVLLPLLIGFATVAEAQTIYEASNILREDVGGTARYVGMGGSMGALGGDISVIRTNPAGIGLYRSNDLTVTLGTNTTATSALGNKFRNTEFSFDNVGIVYSFRNSNTNPLRFVNFAFNYSKRVSFDNSWRGGWTDHFSQTDQIANMASNGTGWDGELGYLPEQLESKCAYVDNNPYVGWLPLLGYEGCLIEPVNGDDGKPTGAWTGYPFGSSVAHAFSSEESGWVNDYDFNISFNVSDKVYLGATITASDVNYKKNTLYKEDFWDGSTTYGGYDINNYFSTHGAGVSFTLGGIIRVSPTLRLGLSFSTPTRYWLTDHQEASLAYDVDVYDSAEGGNVARSGVANPKSDAGSFMSYEYNYVVRTPWKLNVSFGGTLGRRFAFNAEYEYRDNTKAAIRYDDNSSIDNLNLGYMESNGALFGGIDQSFKKQHTAKLGVEFLPLAGFSVRAGFNYSSAIMDKAAFKFMESQSARTDTEWNNLYGRYVASVGAGYRGKRGFYVDMTYQYQTSKSDFYAFDNTNLLPIELKTNKHHVFLSVGKRF